MKIRRSKKASSVRIGKNLKFRLADLEAIAAKHEADCRRGAHLNRPLLGNLDDLISRFPSSAAVAPHVVVPLSKRNHARLCRIAKTAGLDVESLLALWVRQTLDRLDDSR